MLPARAVVQTYNLRKKCSATPRNGTRRDVKRPPDTAHVQARRGGNTWAAAELSSTSSGAGVTNLREPGVRVYRWC